MAVRFQLLLLSALLVPVIPTPSTAVTIRVPSQQPTIQAGILAASDGDTVLIAPGTYTGMGNRDVRFYGRNVVVKSEQGPQSTTMNCQDLGRGFILIDGETSAATLRGLTITNGMAPVGSGVLCVGSGVTIVNCVLRQNDAADKGGGLCCVWSDVSLDSCSFIDNRARNPVETFRGDGGGVFCENSTLVFSRCAFTGNFVGGSGGGLYSQGAHVDLDDCRFEGNESADGQGGAMAASGFSTGNASSCMFVSNRAPDGGAAVLYGSPLRFSNCRFESNSAVGAFGCKGGAVLIGSGSIEFHGCLFSHNFASDIEDEGNGGAIFIDQSADAHIAGSTLYENTASTGRSSVGRGSGVYVGFLASANLENTIIVASNDAEAIYCSPQSTVSLRCCDLYGNEGGDWIGCIAGLYGIDGNISAGPFFCDPENGDFGLASFSPCAPEHSPGKCGLIGAYGVACESVVGIADPGLAAGSGSLGIWNYPNPFNPATTIVYQVPNPGTVTLKIFDVAGRAVRSLLVGLVAEPGQHRVLWDGTDGSGHRVESGVYFGHLQIGSEEELRRLVLIK